MEDPVAEADDILYQSSVNEQCWLVGELDKTGVRGIGRQSD